MAESPSHKFGQIIGDVLEASVAPYLETFAERHGLYLDRKGKVRSCRTGKKISWVDWRKNKHDLDFVLERGGSNERLGIPVAFIECAWRRYTKHSKNKAQEIQGAILALAETYKDHAPFLGAILAGEFTAGALQQLRSNSFAVLYISYDSIVRSFATVGIDAAFTEDTSDRELATKVSKWDSLRPTQKNKVLEAIIKDNGEELSNFVESLRLTIEREIHTIVILPLYGTSAELTSIVEAIEFVKRYSESSSSAKFQKYEVIIKFKNGSRIDGQFVTREDAVKFLQIYSE